ncbi:hypothetical protein RBSWK_01152 [Rhodopirellula baltica SWK14]|uniref:Uncharacterized protein n=1 Tax=Rhodopirellula baltica SWK14 TaxID=993516 RepID=L7CKQ2_RHOBT|nr:hypothetical protein RBSWK_01152 [Rhodopirellula baltica SWK14]
MFTQNRAKVQTAHTISPNNPADLLVSRSRSSTIDISHKKKANFF